MSEFTSFRGVSFFFGEDDTDKIDIISSNTDPSVSGLEADLNSIALQPDGIVHIKTGVLNTDWEGGGKIGGLTGQVPFFRANGTQENIPLIGLRVPFFRANGTRDDIALV